MKSVKEIKIILSSSFNLDSKTHIYTNYYIHIIKEIRESQLIMVKHLNQNCLFLCNLVQ